MYNKSLESLEFSVLKEKIKSYISCELAGQIADDLYPVTDKDEIISLLRETEDAYNFVIRRGSPPAFGTADITGSVRRASFGGTLTLVELLNISGMLRSVRRLISYAGITDADSENSMLARISSLTENKLLEDTINRCIISEEEMADDASPLLYDIRRKLVSTQNSIKEKLGELTRSSKYSKALQDSVVTIRSGRYCVPVKIEYRSEISGIVHDTSSSGQTLFIEPAFVVDANNKIRELKIQEQEEISRILKELSETVASYEHELIRDVKELAYIDFTFAKARLASEMKAIKPEISENGEIKIINGRHPLIEKHNVVPINIFLGTPEQNNASAMIITGPNTGGKTVTLKTVGLFSVMMQSGLLIPADEHSKIPVFNNIFTDIGDEQSISQNLSTFSAHMKNITEILSECDYNSLILFDELGAGTDPTEGAALAMSILECVQQMGATVFATTHYSELKIFASTTPGFINASCEFDVETLRPTYRLLIGIPGRSNAFAISERLGLDTVIIDRAKEFLSNEDKKFEEMLSGIEKNRKELENQKEETESNLRQSRILLANAKAEKEAMDKEREEFIVKIKTEAREINNKARISADKMLTEIRKAALISGNHESVRAAEKARNDFENESSETEGSISKSETNVSGTESDHFSAGQDVHIISLNCKGTVLSDSKPGEKVYIAAGIMKVYLPASDLRIINQPVKSPAGTKSTNGKSEGNMKALNLKTEIDVRGCTVEEAITLIERHINDAVQAHQPSFTIIHGKGTGALRKGIHQYLSKSKLISGYRLGSFGEGDFGVTIVSLS